MKGNPLLYGYIVFNNNRNGILSNWPCIWAVRRVEADSNDKTLEYAGPFTLGELPSMLKTCQFYPSPIRFFFQALL